MILVGKLGRVDHLSHVTLRLEDKNNVAPYCFQTHPLNYNRQSVTFVVCRHYVSKTRPLLNTYLCCSKIVKQTKN